MSILGENLAVFCPFLETMSEVKFKINRLSNLVEEMLSYIQAVTWLLLTVLVQIYSERE